MIKKIMSVLMIMALPMGVAATSLSAQETEGVKSEPAIEQAQVEKEMHCTVTEIEGTKVMLQSDDGEQLAINVNEAKTLEDLNVGDRVAVKNGKIMKQKEE